MKRHHVYTFGMLLGALALLVAGLDNWSNALRPPFVAGAMTAVAAVLKAMYQDKPGESSTVDVVRFSRGEKP